MSKTNRRNYPLKKVLYREYIYDFLECGHKIPTPNDIIGTYYPEKRRYHKCAKGKRFDFDISR